MRDILKPENVIIKHRLISMGLTDEDLIRPLTVILYEDGCKESADDVKHGINVAGCAAVTLCIPSFNDMTAEGNGKRPLLFMRESVADIVEGLLSIYPAESAVLVAGSESTAAGAILGAIKKNMPFVFLPAGINGKFHPKTALTAKSAVACGKKNLEKIDFLEDNFYCGRSLEMDNLNSLAVFCEGCGISVFGAVSAATLNDRVVIARQTGALAALRAQKMAYPRKDLAEKSIINGLATHLACGGTLASLIHIIAIARENGLNMDFDYIENISEKTPLLCRISPAGERDIIAFGKAGGVKAVLKELSAIPKFLTLNTRYGEEVLSDILSEAAGGDGAVIKLINSPFGRSNVCAIKGNLCGAGLVRKNGDDKPVKGKAVVFDNEELCRSAILGKSVPDGSIVVIKGQSARINGMPLLDIESACSARGLNNVVILTDGRTVELWNNTLISLMDGSEIFDVLTTGDTIDIDFKKSKITADVSSKELSARLKKQAGNDAVTGSLLRYSSLVTGANNGCIYKSKF